MKNFLSVNKILAFGAVILLGLLVVSCAEPQVTVEVDGVDISTESTLDIIRGRGSIIVGVTSGVPGYSAPDSNGVWQGFDVDFGRAVAVAIFNDPNAIEFRPLSATERFTALQSGEIDLLSRVTTWTATRDATLGLNFAGVNFYDGQGFMVANDSGLNSIADLNGATIAVQSGTTTELNLADHFRSNGWDYELITFESNEQAAAALESGRADAITSDSSQLYALRTRFADPTAYGLLPGLISKEPLGPVVRHGDDQFFDLVKWTLTAMINAEELGISSENVANLRMTSTNPAVRRLLGVDESDISEALGVENDWIYNIISTIGNYGEAFERNLGSQSPLNIARGVNALWTNGGLQYGYPYR